MIKMLVAINDKNVVAINDKNVVAINDKNVVAEMRQKCRIDFLSVLL